MAVGYIKTTAKSQSCWSMEGCGRQSNSFMQITQTQWRTFCAFSSQTHAFKRLSLDLFAVFSFVEWKKTLYNVFTDKWLIRIPAKALSSNFLTFEIE